MARFYTEVDNSKGNITSAAGKSAGQTAHIRGWNAGIRVEAVPDADNKDSFRVYSTHGSNGGGRDLVGVLDSEGRWTAAELVCADCMRAGLVDNDGPHCLFCDGPLDDESDNNDDGPCIRTDLVGAGEVVDNG